MLTQVEVEHGLAVVRLSSRSLGAGDLPDLRALLQRLSSQGVGGVLFDMSAIRKLSFAGIATLLELSAVPAVRLGLCQLREGPKSRLLQSGIAKALPLYDSVAQAHRCAQFQKLRMSGCRAVILAAGKGSRVAPLTDETPKPMLDLLGRPIIDHIISHLQSFGIRDLLINPGHLGPQITNHFRARRDVTVFFAHEGYNASGGWVADPIGSASTLARLHHRHSAMPDDTIVMCGDAVLDLDMSELMQAHRASGAEVTIAAKQVSPEETHKYGMIEADADGRVFEFQEKPAPGEARSTLANVGVYVVSPKALSRLPDQPGLDIASDLLPLILKSGGHIQVHAPDFSWVDIGCGRDYYRAVSMALRGDVPGVVPEGREIRPGVWVAEEAWVSRRARFDGPCYVGPHAQIMAGSEFSGPTVVGAHCIVEPRTYIRQSILRPSTRVSAGAFVDQMIAAPQWAVDHRLADGSLQNRSALERLCGADEDLPQFPEAGFQIARTA